MLKSKLVNDFEYYTNGVPKLILLLKDHYRILYITNSE